MSEERKKKMKEEAMRGHGMAGMEERKLKRAREKKDGPPKEKKPRELSDAFKGDAKKAVRKAGNLYRKAKKTVQNLKGG